MAIRPVGCRACMTPTCHTGGTPAQSYLYICSICSPFVSLRIMKNDGSELVPGLDVESLRLDSSSAISTPAHRKPRRFNRGEKFLRGPIPWSWLSIAARLPGKALSVGLAIWHLNGFKNTGTVELSRRPLEDLGVSRQAGYRGLRTLEG